MPHVALVPPFEEACSMRSHPFSKWDKILVWTDEIIIWAMGHLSIQQEQPRRWLGVSTVDLLFL